MVHRDDSEEFTQALTAMADLQIGSSVAVSFSDGEQHPATFLGLCRDGHGGIQAALRWGKCETPLLIDLVHWSRIEKEVNNAD